jgi:hypothetical protein
MNEIKGEFKAYITKYALTQGIIEMDVFWMDSPSDPRALIGKSHIDRTKEYQTYYHKVNGVQREKRPSPRPRK